MIKPYCGIGARKCPKEICEIMTKLATKLEKDNWVLRSGAAEGADRAFSEGVYKLGQIFLPWKGFSLDLQLNKNQHDYIVVGADDQEAEESVNLFHPNGPRLKDSVRAMMRRNYRQIVGRNGEPNSSFCICWTENGEDVGGSGQALRICAAHSIPVFNLQREEDLKRIRFFLDK